MSWLAATFAAFLALVLAAAALHKAFAPARLARATAALTRLPDAKARPLMVCAGAVEAAASLAILLPSWRTAGLLAAAGLWTLYAALLARGDGVADCGCTLSRGRGGGSARAVPRAGSLALLAALTALLPAPASMPPDAPFAGAALLALFLASGEILALPALRRRRPT